MSGSPLPHPAAGRLERLSAVVSCAPLLSFPV